VEQVIFTRHGESAYSALGLMNGDASVPVGLTKGGVEQARRLGEELRDVPLDLAVTSALPRTIATADEALRGRDVPRAVIAELNDPRYGDFEGKHLDDYREWARSTSSSTPAPGGGESRLDIVARYTRAFRQLLARPEPAILVVAHSLPIAYAVLVRDGADPGAHMPLVEYATQYPFTAAELEEATAALERWVAAPGW
jgi:broad specificity phosphatase PhoE